MKDKLHIIKKEGFKLIYLIEQNRVITPKSDEVYDVVCKVIKSDTLSDKEEIIRTEFLSLLGPDEVATSTFDFFEQDTTQTNKITLMLTQKCNLACKYCYGGDSGTFNSSIDEMDIETAIRSVDYLLEKSPAPSRYHILFFGGEPLLNFEVMKGVVSYCEKLEKKTGKKFGYSLTTNGTLLTNEILNFFKEKEVGITISIDGTKEQHDRYRIFRNGIGSYDTIIKNIKRIKDKGLGYAIRATLPFELFDRYDEVNSHLKSLGARNVFISRISVYEEVNNKKLGEGHTDNNDLYVKFHDHTKTCSSIERAEQHKKLLESIHTASKKRIHCGLMKGTTTVSTNGELYPCHRFVGIKGFTHGTITEGVSKEKMKKILDELDDSTSKCNSCFARYICQRNCVREIAVAGGEFSGFSEEFCSQVKESVEEALVSYVQMLKNNSQLLNQSHEEADC